MSSTPSPIQIFETPESTPPEPLIVKLIPASMERIISKEGCATLIERVPIATLCAVDSLGSSLSGGRLLALTPNGVYLFGGINYRILGMPPAAFSYDPIRRYTALNIVNTLRGYSEVIKD